MKRYSFDIPQCIAVSVRGIAVMAFLGCVVYPAALQATLTKPDLLRVSEAADGSVLLVPDEVEDGLRQRFQNLQTRQRSREEAMDAVAPRDYNVDAPPAHIDVPLPADAFGGEIFQERIEVAP